MNARGFTLIELVISIAIASIVVVFATMFISAPIGAYEAHSRRAALVDDTSGAWPRMERDLHAALPNSLRTRRNGSFVVIEMLRVVAVVRYIDPPSAYFKVAGGVATIPGYLSEMPGADVYAPGGSLASAAGFSIAAEGASGEYRITLVAAPSFPASPRQRLYFVEGPVTYLCDESRGTLRRYANYAVAQFQTARDTPAEMGSAGELVTQGLTSCNFVVADPVAGNPFQTAAVHLTTTRNGDSITLLHTARAEYAP
ncbi:MAG: prepilin-type N-terminal cleavage/methylation domain-containing protein [Steroidobacteraceae bacterium]|nr:prepilin-type N-terminal cleavage/methylation domain-containing protein [Steroidobacteraceae bacterium]